MPFDSDHKINISRVINMLYLAYNIIWPALGRLVLQIDAAGRTGMILLALVIFFNFSKLEFWRTFTVRPIFLWLLWCLLVSGVGLYKGIHIDNTTPILFLYTKVFTPFLIMTIVFYEIKRDPKGLVLNLAFFFLMYMLIGIIVQRGAKLYQGRVSGGLWNDMPLTSLAFVSIVMLANIKKWLSAKYVLIALLLAIIATMMVATRKAFIALSILTVFWYLSAYDARKASSVIFGVLAIILVYVGITYIMDNTVIGQRFSILEEEGQQYNKSSYAILNFLGDRITYYIEGWKIYKANPIFGIGLWNYGYVLPSDMPIHSEYMVQLAECGTLGAVLFLMFYYSLLKCVFRIRKVETDNKMWLTLLGTMLFVIFIDLSSWTYSSRSYFVLFGIIIGLSEYVKADRDAEPRVPIEEHKFDKR